MDTNENDAVHSGKTSPTPSSVNPSPIPSSTIDPDMAPKPQSTDDPLIEFLNMANPKPTSSSQPRGQESPNPQSGNEENKDSYSD